MISSQRRHLVTALATSPLFAFNGSALANSHLNKIEAIYPKDNLGQFDPVLSSATILEHGGKHHQAYANRLPGMIAGTLLEGASLEKIISLTASNKHHPIYRNAAMLWNHNFYWASLRPKGGGVPPQKLRELIERDFGNQQKLIDELANKSASHFGDGWGWLVQDKAGRLSVITTDKADSPMELGLNPLLTIDLWEHAYYIDYKSGRAAYTRAIVANILNWEFCHSNLT